MSDPEILTVGHGARPIADLVAMLDAARVERVVDVRTAPGSRKHPQFNRDALAASLPEHGIAYAWRRELGGWRRARPDSRHVALRNESFRGYADHMETEPFDEALRWLEDTSRGARTAVMCSETLWWRCHRSMIADALVARGWKVRHVMPGGRLEVHTLRDAARVEDGRPVYDVVTGQGRLDA